MGDDVQWPPATLPMHAHKAGIAVDSSRRRPQPCCRLVLSPCNFVSGNARRHLKLRRQANTICLPGPTGMYLDRVLHLLPSSPARSTAVYTPVPSFAYLSRRRAHLQSQPWKDPTLTAFFGVLPSPPISWALPFGEFLNSPCKTPTGHCWGQQDQTMFLVLWAPHPSH